MQTKQIVLLLYLSAATLPSCTQREPNTPVEKKEEIPHKPRRADVKDEHGCLTSGGYVWSEVKQNCIRLWEVAEELEQANDWEPVVFVLVSDDHSSAEIFIPDEGSIVLQKQGTGHYTNDSFSLSQNGKNYNLAVHGKSVYRSPSIMSPQEPRKPAGRKKRR